MDVIILAGGEGTRIRHLLPEGMPKCMADVNGMPFIDILVDHLRGIDVGREDPSKFGDNGRFIFATGYGASAIEHHLQTRYRFGMHGCRWWEFSREEQPLGTAGAIKYLWEPRYRPIYPELQGPPEEPLFIFNGDTFCDVYFKAMLAYHKTTNSIITVACDKEFRPVGTFIVSKQFVDFIQPLDSGLCKGCGHEWEEHNIDSQYERECSACGDCYDYEFNPKSKVNIEDVLAILGHLHESVGWFVTDAPFYDIGSPEGISEFRNYWAQLPKGGEGHMVGNIKDSV